MLITGFRSIRDVIAFPKTQKATCPLTEAPSSVSRKQLTELYLRQILSGPNVGAESTGTYDPANQLTDSSGQVRFTYVDSGGPGTDVIVARFTNAQNQLVQSQQATVTWSTNVENPPPVIDSVSITAVPCAGTEPGDNVELNVSFTDPNLQDTHTVTIDWGDGSDPDSDGSAGETLVLPVGDRTFSVNHVFATGGVFPVAISVVDDQGGADAVMTEAWVIGRDQIQLLVSCKSLAPRMAMPSG